MSGPSSCENHITVSTVYEEDGAKEYLDREELMDIFDEYIGLKVINAPSGTGKTRFLAEYACRATGDGIRVIYLTRKRVCASDFVIYLDRHHGKPFPCPGITVCDVDKVAGEFKDVPDFSEYVLMVDNVTDILPTILEVIDSPGGSRVLNLIRQARMAIFAGSYLDKFVHHRIIQQLRRGTSQ